MRYKNRQLSELAKVLLEWSDTMGDHHYQAHQVVNQYAILLHEHKKLENKIWKLENKIWKLENKTWELAEYE